MALSPSGTVVYCIHAGHAGQQGLGGADVGGGPFALDMLFAGLQGHAEGGFSLPVDRNADDPARQKRLYASRVAKKAACGPPYPMGMPKRWVDPTTTSAPHSPGGVSRTRLMISAATATVTPVA